MSGLTVEELAVIDIATLGLLDSNLVRRTNIAGHPGAYYYFHQYRAGVGTTTPFTVTHPERTTTDALREAFADGTYDGLMLRIEHATVSGSDADGSITVGPVDNVYNSDVSLIQFGDITWSGDSVPFAMPSLIDSEDDTSAAMSIFYVKTDGDEFQLLRFSRLNSFTYTTGSDPVDLDGIARIVLYGVSYGTTTTDDDADDDDDGGTGDVPSPVWQAATYVTVDEIKASLSGGGDMSALDDSLLEQAAVAATTQIDNYCGRDFLTAGSGRIVPTHTWFADSRTCASLPYPVAVPVSDETFYMSYNFWTYPSGEPVADSIAFFSFSAGSGWSGQADTAADGNVFLSDIITFEGYDYYTTMCTKNGLQFEMEGDTTGRRFTVYVSSTTWGLRETPAPVRRAALLIATRLIRRQDSPLGVTGFGDLGAVFVRTVDPDVARLLDPYRTNVWFA